MQRFTTLTHCGNGLVESVQNNLDWQQKARAEFRQAADDILRDNNALGELQRVLEEDKAFRKNMVGADLASLVCFDNSTVLLPANL